MKFLKNKAKKALMAAVTMSLVMGVCGSAMAADNYYGQASGGWDTSYLGYAAASNFTGEWNGLYKGSETTASHIFGAYAYAEPYYGPSELPPPTTYKDTNNNTLTISGGIIEVSVYGTYCEPMGVWGNAKENNVTITGGNIGGDVYGAQAANQVTDNTVTISGGIIKGWVCGGRANNNAANNNTVTISGVDIGKDVYGGWSSGTANDNTVILKGGNVAGKVYGGYATGSGKGNTLIVADKGIKVGGLSHLQKLQFELPADIKAKDDMLVVLEDSSTNLQDVESITVMAADGIKLKVNDTVNLIHKTGVGALNLYAGSGPSTSIFDPATGKVNDAYAKLIVISSPLSATSGEVSLKALDGNEDGGNPNDLVFTALENIGVDDSQAPEGLADNAKSHVETRANGAALLNEGADFMMEQGMASAKAAAKEGVKEGNKDLVPFVAVGAGNMRYKTGSHVDSKSWHAGVGVSKQVGDMVFGIAVEHGKSDYDSYVNAAHGEGKSQATGGTIFAEIKKESGVHFDAAVRAGRIKNDYSANLMGFHSSYDESSTYYGMSIGGGKEFAVSDKDAVDVYGRYYWAHTNSSDATTNLGDKLNFNAVNSHRIRLGSRYTHTVNDMNKVYAGLAWQYEFSGETKATINGSNAPAPGLKGHSGMLELGWKVEAAKNMSVDLNMTGWAGKQRGLMGGVNMQWKF